MKKQRMISYGLAIILLTGCGGSTEKQISAVLKKTAEAEEEFVKQQQPLKELEKKEMSIYKKMMTSSGKEKKRWSALQEKAEKNLNDRKEKVFAEQEAMKKAADEFSKLDELKKRLEDKQVRGELDGLIKTMNERYKAHQDVAKRYNEVLRLDKKLYYILGKETTTLSDVEEQLDKINKENDKLKMSNERFNKLTRTFNKQKTALEKSIESK
ncbi:MULTISPECIES: YkyA family protein [Bacillaceae]|uniref:YkyA family protein n=1 Tax=Bacillaceae TaxID=186817 RepID=UPI001602958D|nr:YkyA family protein [Bacillus sp. PK3_68]